MFSHIAPSMGSHLDKPVTEKDSEDHTLHGGLLHCASAMQGWRHQEDSHVGDTIEWDDITASLIAVFDGHGGDFVAKEAAKRIKSMLLLALRGVDSKDAEAIGEAMQKAFMSLDNDLRKLCSAIGDQSGATAIVAIVTDKHIIVANAGDARGILMSGDTVRAMSSDHGRRRGETVTRGRCGGSSCQW